MHCFHWVIPGIIRWNGSTAGTKLLLWPMTALTLHFSGQSLRILIHWCASPWGMPTNTWVSLWDTPTNTQACVWDTPTNIQARVCGIRPPIPIFVELDYHNFRNLQPRSIGFYSLLIQNLFYSYLSGHMFLSATLVLMPSKARRGRTSIKSSEAVVTGSGEPPDVVVRPWSGVLQKSSKHS